MAKRQFDTTRNAGLARRARDLPLLLLILLIGLVLRVGYLRELMQTPDYAAPLADATFHDYWARGLVTGDWTPPAGCTDPHIGTTPYLRPPGYPWFLALVYRVAGPSNYLAIRVVQMALGLVSAGLAYWLGRAVFGRGVGLLAAPFLCVHWAFIYYEGELQEPCLIVLLGLLAVVALHQWTVRPGVWRAALAGLLLGIFAIVRPNILLFLPVAALWIGWVQWRRGQWSRSVPSALALLMAAAVPVLPVTIRNFVVAHDFVPISTNGAVSLYVGNNQRSDGYTARIPELYELTGENAWSWFNYDKIVAGVAAELGRPAKHSDVEVYFRDRALQYMRANPGRTLGLTAKRILLFWGPAEVANNKEVHFERQFSHWLWWLPGFPLAAATGVLGLALVVWRKCPLPVVPLQGRGISESVVLLLLYILVWFVSFIPFLVAERFRTPIAAFVAMFGACGVIQLGRWAVARDWRRLAGWGAVAVGLLVLAEINWVGYEPQLSGWHMARGDAFGRLGKWEEARREYARTIELKPSYLAARATLANALCQLGRRDEALQQYRKLVEARPDDPNVFNAMGGLLLDLNLVDDAEQAFDQALKLKPGVAGVHANRGIALMRQRKLEQAMNEFREALRLDPRLAEAHYNLGLAFAAQGHAEEAMAAYRATLAVEPAYHQARVNLGVLLAQQGQFDAAIAEYRQVLARDPRQFEALYNLASALATQGQRDAAITALKRALEVRPDNGAARRALESLQQGSG
jgi:tetratricopeptide (TPR) repeat protein